MFKDISNLNNHIKMMDMQRETTRKIKENDFSSSQTMANESRQFDPRSITIQGKLRAGQTLTSYDLSYLRDTDPVMYQKAVKITKERKDFADSLRRCRSKDEVLSSKTARISSIASEMNRSGGTVDDRAELVMRATAVGDEYLKFTRKERYKKLPNLQLDLGKRSRIDSFVAIKKVEKRECNDIAERYKTAGKRYRKSKKGG